MGRSVPVQWKRGRFEDVFRIENRGHSFSRVYLNLRKTTFWEFRCRWDDLFRYRWLFLTGWKRRMKMRLPFGLDFFCCFFFFGVFEKEVIVAYLFWNWVETSLKICWWTKLLHQYIQHMLHQETMSYACVFSTFLQPDHRLGSPSILHISCKFLPEAPPAPRSIAEAERVHENRPKGKVNRLHWCFQSQVYI